MQKLSVQSKDLSQENIRKIEEIFPNCVTETYDQDGNLVRSIDFDILRQDLSDHVVEGPKERYQFNWPGKREAILLANAPTTNTLRPLPEKSVDFENTKNVYIEGDNLEALKILRETYMGKIKMIYIDPPYNTGNDFVYKDDFKQSTEDYLKSSGNIDEEGNRMEVNGESNGRFHSDWLNMMYPRLILARDLLTDDGLIFMSIDDNEQDNLVRLGKEIFGESNYIGCFPRVTKKSGKAHSSTLARNHDYIFLFAKNSSMSTLAGVTENSSGFDFEDEYVDSRGKYKLNQTLDYNSLWYNPAMDFEVVINNENFYPGGSKEGMEERHSGKHNPKDWVWRWSKKKLEFGLKNGFVVVKKTKNGSRIYTKTYLGATISKDENGNYFVEEFKRDSIISSLAFTQNEFSNDNAKKDLGKIMDSNSFDFPKPVALLKALVSLVGDKEGYFLDFFSGSGTLAQAILEKNSEDQGKRKFVLIQIPEQIDENTSSFALGLKTICDVAELRVKKIAEKISEDISLINDSNFDAGLKVFKVDSSNMKDILSTPKETQLSLLENAESAIKPDRNSLDLVTQVMLQLGITLDADIKIGKFAGGGQFYAVNGNDLVCCFDKNISESSIEEMAKLQPLSVAFRDDSFASDQDEVNCEQIFKTLSPITGKNIFVL